MKSNKSTKKLPLEKENNLTQIKNIPLDKDLEINHKKIEQLMGTGPNTFTRKLLLESGKNKKTL